MPTTPTAVKKMPTRIHLDTDIGSDPDDACALAMLLGWPGVELTGITTTIDPGGRRAGYVAHVLELAGAGDVPVAAGAEVSLTTQTMPGTIGDDERYWGASVAPRPSPSGKAVELLEASLAAGATVVAIGPYTNLALLATMRPAALTAGRVVLMGGWLRHPPDGFPRWGPETDWNVQCDTAAAEVVIRSAGELTFVPLSATAQVHLRSAHLPRLDAAGPIGELIARQARAYASDRPRSDVARDLAGLPEDLVNFHHDPLACAVALGWQGASLETVPSVRPALHDGVLLLEETEQGGSGSRSAHTVGALDGEAFAEQWLTCVEQAGGVSRGGSKASC